MSPRPQAPVTPRLQRDAIHVWRAGLDPPAKRLETLGAILAHDERQRANRFRFDRHRRRYIAGRGVLRLILGGYLGWPPEAVELTYGVQGKPGLRDAGGCLPDLRFNVSHSADEALFAVSLGREVGVDIERVRDDMEFDAIARRFFSPREAKRLRDLPAVERPGAFFECWTRKESFVKACGGGLQVPLDGFDVAFGPGARAELLGVRWDPQEVDRWSMAALDVTEGFRGALTVAAAGGPWSVRRLEAAGLGRPPA